MFVRVFGEAFNLRYRKSLFQAHFWCYFIGIPGSTEASVHFMNLPLKEKRKHYICRERFKTLMDLNIYSELVKFNRPRIQQLADRNYRKGNSFILNANISNTFR